MGLLNLMHDHRFNTFFSFVVGIGLICILRPMCSGPDCVISKAPSEADFDKHVYRMGGGKCYEFNVGEIHGPTNGNLLLLHHGGLVLHRFTFLLERESYREKLGLRW